MNKFELAMIISKTIGNRDDITKSNQCGCYSCGVIFEPKEIKKWGDSESDREDDQGVAREDGPGFHGITACCPYCDNWDIVPAFSCGIITKDLLRQLKEYWK